MRKKRQKFTYTPDGIKNMIKINCNADFYKERLGEYLNFFKKDISFVNDINNKYSIESIDFKIKYLYPNFFNQMDTNYNIFNSYSNASEYYALRQLIGRPNKFDNEIRIFNYMKNNLKTNAIVMDYGCCVGDFTIFFAKMGYNVIALDLENRTFDFAKKRFKDRRLNIKTYSISCDMKLPIISGKVDFIFCRDVLEHTVNPMKILKYFYDNLSSEGIMYISTMNPGDKIYIGAEHLEKTIKLANTKEYKDFFENYFINVGIHGLYKKNNKK